MIHSKRHLHFVFDLFVCVSLSPCLQTLRILDFFEGTLGVMYTLAARRFSCAVSGFGQVRPAAEEMELPDTREKKPLVTRVGMMDNLKNDP